MNVRHIHMNGRVYDYNVGRFASVDPFIQAPTSSQSINPYSYIMNNPLAGVDPSGYASDCNKKTGSNLCSNGLSDGTLVKTAPGPQYSGGGNGAQSTNSSSQSNFQPGNGGEYTSGNDTSTMGSRAKDLLKGGADLFFSNTQKFDPNVDASFGDYLSGGGKFFGNAFDSAANAFLDIDSPVSNMSVRDVTDLLTVVTGADLSIPTIDIAGPIEQNETGGAALVELGTAGLAVFKFSRLAGTGKAANASTVDKAGSIRNVNPTNGTGNCVNCSIATDATLAGRSASALPGNPTSVAVLEKIFGASFKPVAGQAQITSIMQNAGNGARGIVFGASKHANRPGHVFNVVNQKGTIRFLDGQTGNKASFNNLKNFELLRTN